MIGFDIGGTKCAVCIGEPRENRFIISDKRSLATKDARDPYEMIEWLCSAAEEMTDDLSRVGISCGGPLDTARGLILSPPNLPGWDGIPIVELVEKRLGCRAALQSSNKKMQEQYFELLIVEIKKRLRCNKICIKINLNHF